MESYDKYIQKFLKTICKQVRFKSIHKNISDELSDHIYHQKDEFIRQGFDEETSTIKAVEQMGDPIDVGKQLNNTHRPRTEWSILTLATTLIMIGCIIQYLLFSVTMSNSAIFSHFLTYLPIGIGAFLITYFFDYTLLGRYSKRAFFILFIGTVASFNIFDIVNKSYIQVYYSILLFIPGFAGIIYGFRGKGYFGILATGLFYVLASLFCFISHKTSMLFMLSLPCLIVLTVSTMKGYFGGNKKISMAIVYISTVITMLISFLATSPYRIERLSTFFNPEADPLGTGYQFTIVRSIIKSAQFIGKATLDGKLGTMKLEQVLPGWNSDLFLTYIIGQLGFVPAIIIVALLFILIIRMFVSVMKQKNAYGFLVSLAACIAITIQIAIYVMGNFGLTAPIASTLPFISFSATSFVVNMILLGLVLSVYRRTDLVKDNLPKIFTNKSFIVFEDGKLIIDLGIKSQ